MDDDLREMLDHHRIRKVLAEYCRGSDRCDEALMASVYARDSWDDHGTVRATGEEFARVMCASIVATTQTMTHVLGQSSIEINGDEAGAETYFIAIARELRPDGVDACEQLGGRFVDRLVREDGQWKVKRRDVVRDWSVAIPMTYDWDSSNELTPGSRSNDDLSFAVLGKAHSGRYGSLP